LMLGWPVAARERASAFSEGAHVSERKKNSREKLEGNAFERFARKRAGEKTCGRAEHVGGSLDDRTSRE